MTPLPHKYQVTAHTKGGHVLIASEDLPDLVTAAPEDFGGPGDRWSPETLLVGAVADCFILTFKAIATAAKMSYLEVECDVTGVLDKVDRGMQFTQFHIKASARIADEQYRDKVLQMMEKAEANCLVTRSLKADIQFEGTVSV